MRLTEAEMNLEDLKYTPGFAGATIGKLLLFQPNSNIDQRQSVLVAKEIIHRCNCYSALLVACKLGRDEINSQLKPHALLSNEFLTIKTYWKQVADVLNEAIAKAEGKE